MTKLPPKLPRKPKRDSRWRSPGHLAFVRSHQCSIPGCAEMPIEAAHVRFGSGAGMGEKPCDHRAVSLCAHHHRQQHTIGEPAFWAMYYDLAGQEVDALIEAFCKASPKAADIWRSKAERPAHG